MKTDFILKLYYDLIILPLEKECYRLEGKIYSNNFFDLLLRATYKEDLKIYNQLLCEQYKKIGEWIMEEELFMDDLKEKFMAMAKECNRDANPPAQG